MQHNGREVDVGAVAGSPVRVSWQRTADGSPLGKAHTLQGDVLHSASVRRYVEGCIAEETQVRSVGELLEQAHELGASAHRFSGTFEEWVAGKVLHSDGSAPGATQDFLAHRDGPGVICIDIDRKHLREPWLTHEQVRDGLRAIAPWLVGVELLVMDSSSSCIALDGQEVKGPGGVHAYALVDSAPMIPALLGDGQRRAFLAGLGRVIVSGGAACLPRSPFDLALIPATQPDFMVPHLGSERLSRSREPSIFPGGRIPVSAALLQPADGRRYDAILAGEKALLEPARRAKAEERAIARGTAAHARLGGKLEAHIKAARRAFVDQALPLDFAITLEDGELRTVAEVLDDPSLVRPGWSLPDPLDPDYGPHRAKLDAEHKVIVSCAHGIRHHYSLGAKPAEAEGRRPLVVSHLSLADVQHPPRERFLLGRTIPLGKASVLFGPSSVGKSAAAAQVALALAAGNEALWGLPLLPGGGPVLVYSAEDTLDDWKRKAAALLSTGDSSVARAIKRIGVIDQSEGVARLSEVVTIRTGTPDRSITRHVQQPTEEQEDLIREALALRAVFVLVETASRLVDDEDNANLAALMSALGRIARETGAAVAVTHHPTKTSEKDNDSSTVSARGGGAFIANSRNALSLFPAADEVAAEFEGRIPADDLVVLVHGKSTSSTRKQAPITLVRTESEWGAVLRLPEEVDLSPAQAERAAARASAAQERDWKVLRALYSVVEGMLAVGDVSMTGLRPRVKDIGVRKDDLGKLLERAVRRRVLKCEKRHGGRGHVYFLDQDPRGPISGTTEDDCSESEGTTEPPERVQSSQSSPERKTGTTAFVPGSSLPLGSQDYCQDDCGTTAQDGTTAPPERPSKLLVEAALRKAGSASPARLMSDTGLPEDVVLDELDRLDAPAVAGLYRHPEASP